jgi:ABC-2 type transport system ATP-binding protein
VIIRTENLTRKFGALTAVDHLNLEIAEGEIFALVGPDGAGKTTTMRMLCGLMNPTEGKAIVAGHDVSLELEAVKDQIGYMAQRFGLYSDLTVAENMTFYSDLFGVTGQERRADGEAAAHDAHGAVSEAAGGKTIRRDETEARPDVHSAA